MAAFNLADFDMGYGSERYVKYKGEFVARFKYAKPAACARHFVKFLVANFTVEEYFAQRAEGKAPTAILETKGYIHYNTLAAMKRGGFATKEELLARSFRDTLARVEARGAQVA